MNTRRWMPAVSAMGIWLSALPALAQKQDEKPAPPAGGPTVSLQFSGGSLADYVKALQAAAPQFNIVLAVPEAKEVQLPPIKLDSVSYYPSLRLLQGDYRLEDGSTVRLLVNDLGGPREGETALPVYKIWSERHETKKPPTQVRVWSIGDLFLGDRKAEQILTAVETAVGLLKGLPAAQIRYHAETTLVMASGDEEQLRAIDRVVEELKHSTNKPGKLGD